MRILHVIPSLSGGGAERQLSYLVPALLSVGVDAHVAFVQPGPNLERLLEVDQNLHRMAAVGNHSVKRYTNLSKLIDRLAPDLIQTWLPQMDILGGVAAIRKKIPFVLSERNSAGLYQRSVKVSARKAIGRKASAIVANSRGGIEYWKNSKEFQIRRVIPNGVPTEDIRMQASESAPAEYPTILFAGRYTEQKNVIFTLQSVVRTLEINPTVRAVFFGAGQLKSTLQDIVIRSTVADRISIGAYSESLWEWMGRASVLVSLSSFEGMPNVALEAAAAGCPLVLSDIPAHRELFGENGAIYLTGASLETASIALTQALFEPAQGQGRVAAARIIASEFSVKNSANAYQELYRELLERRDGN